MRYRAVKAESGVEDSPMASEGGGTEVVIPCSSCHRKVAVIEGDRLVVYLRHAGEWHRTEIETC